jgi:hypothetical protein
MKNILLVLIVLAMSAYVSAQQKNYTVSGTIKSKTTNQAIEGVMITSIPGKEVVVSSQDGKYSIKISENDSVLMFSHLSFETKKVNLSKKENQVINLQLNERFVELEGITISTKAQTVFGTQKYWVHDYEFRENYIFLIAYKKDLDESELLVLDSDQQLIKSILIPDVPSEFFRDCFGNIHIIGATTDLELSLNQQRDSVDILFLKAPVEKFNQTLRPFTGKINDYFYLQSYGRQKLSTTYYCINSKEKKSKPFCSVSDEAREKMYQDEGRRYNKLLEIQDSGMGSPGLEALIYSTPFTAEQIYKYPVDVCMEVMRDSVYVFDFYNKKIEAYSYDGNFSRKVPADYGSYKTWKKILLKDEATNEVYTVFCQGGYYTLKRINMADGTLEGKWEIGFQYPKNIKVNNGYIYFIYRPFETLQTKYLYKIKM